MRRLIAIALLLISAGAASAEIFHSRESALKLAFPEAESFESESVILSAHQVEEIESRSRTRLESRLVNVHIARSDEGLVGYAFLETHTIRSLPETILVAIAPDGTSRSVHLLAFHEPSEYQPSERWLAQFGNRELDDELSLRGGLSGIAGATMTANAITAAVRRLLAIFEVAVAVPKTGSAAESR
jgi:hypothetical protein